MNAQLQTIPQPQTEPIQPQPTFRGGTRPCGLPFDSG